MFNFVLFLNNKIEKEIVMCVAIIFERNVLLVVGDFCVYRDWETDRKSVV